MKTLIITKNKFKKDKEKIDNILITYGLKKIIKDTYIGNISKEEQNEFIKETKKIYQTYDTIIIIPLCQRCLNNIYQIGTEINLEEEKYVIL